MAEFVSFPKMARLSREIIVTEKIDGTNAQIYIPEDNPEQIFAGSRTRWVTFHADNYGFAAWVEANKEELLKLGPGRHFGEWWGKGIQRGYGQSEKRFSLFNTTRWADPEARPLCCDVVPTLYQGVFDTQQIELCLNALREDGSVAAPGFIRPEGIVVYHTVAGVGFKKTCERDDKPKSNKS